MEEGYKDIILVEKSVDSCSFDESFYSYKFNLDILIFGELVASDSSTDSSLILGTDCKFNS